MNKNIVIYLFLCLLVSFLYIAGLVFFLTDHEPGDKCEMTYMFEYPQYVVSTHFSLIWDFKIRSKPL